MIFKYGAYAHDMNEVMIRISQQGIFDTFNRRMGEVIEWTIDQLAGRERWGL